MSKQAEKEVNNSDQIDLMAILFEEEKETFKQLIVQEAEGQKDVNENRKKFKEDQNTKKEKRMWKQGINTITHPKYKQSHHKIKLAEGLTILISNLNTQSKFLNDVLDSQKDILTSDQSAFIISKIEKIQKEANLLEEERNKVLMYNKAESNLELSSQNLSRLPELIPLDEKDDEEKNDSKKSDKQAVLDSLNKNSPSSKSQTFYEPSDQFPFGPEKQGLSEPNQPLNNLPLSKKDFSITNQVTSHSIYLTDKERQDQKRHSIISSVSDSENSLFPLDELTEEDENEDEEDKDLICEKDKNLSVIKNEIQEIKSDFNKIEQNSKVKNQINNVSNSHKGSSNHNNKDHSDKTKGSDRTLIKLIQNLRNRLTIVENNLTKIAHESNKVKTENGVLRHDVQELRKEKIILQNKLPEAEKKSLKEQGHEKTNSNISSVTISELSKDKTTPVNSPIPQ